MTGLPYFVAVVGYARTGKDSAVGFLGKHFGYKRVASADLLKDLAYAANPLVSTGGINHVIWSLAELVDEYGWEEAKDRFPGVRQFLVSLGQGGRDVLGSSFWVDQALGRLGDNEGPWALADCRFVNEAAALRARAMFSGARSFVLRVHRPGVGPASEFENEVDQIQVDCHVTADSLDQLELRVCGAINRLLLG